MDDTFDIAELAAIEVDPELLILALERLASAPPKKSRDASGMAVLCARAFGEFYGLDGPEAVETFTPSDALAFGALILRVSALGTLIEGKQVKLEGFDPEAIAEAAATARIVIGKGAPQFQIFDFIARAGKASGPGVPS